MARRTKQEMEQMKSDARYYLIQTNNQPQPAFELMVKEHLESGQSIPYYIKDIKDFIKVSHELALELNRIDQMSKRDQEKANTKQSVIDYILNLSFDDMKAIYSQYKSTVSQSNKLILHDAYMMIYSNDLKEEYIDQSIINLFSTIITDQSVIEETATTVEVTEESSPEIITFSNPVTVWEQLKQGNKVLMNNNELDNLQDYINTLSDEEQDLYFRHFSSLYEQKYACGLLTRCYIGEMKNMPQGDANDKVKTPAEKFMNDEYITNLEFIELCDQYDIDLSYSLNKWCTDKLDNIGLGKYEYHAISKGMFPKELSNKVDELYEAIESSLESANEEEQASNVFNYTVTDNYTPQPLSGTINSRNKEEAYDQLVDIYTDELGVSESDLEITLEDVNTMKPKYGIHYQDIRTESDFYTWASGYDPSNIEVEFTEHFMYVYTFGNFSKQLNLQVFNKSELSSICSELGIPQKGI